MTDEALIDFVLSQVVTAVFNSRACLRSLRQKTLVKVDVWYLRQPYPIWTSQIYSHIKLGVTTVDKFIEFNLTSFNKSTQFKTDSKQFKFTH